ncbi:unnamed protein product [Pleuronectes platessa]|uniref:Cellular retinoic acid-binding protein 1 n=2 Tax=Pleuronectes platessa TaxID=8262 RepID=A0A9N7UBS1_PLEPL|nr:unnamed protein product [Pleuronectes platessa]
MVVAHPGLQFPLIQQPCRKAKRRGHVAQVVRQKDAAKFIVSMRLDPGNKLSEALCQYETLAATMGSASNYTVDRHQHKGAERGPPPFSHTPKNESVCCWRKEPLCGCQREFMFIRWAPRLLDGTCMYTEEPRDLSKRNRNAMHVYNNAPSPWLLQGRGAVVVAAPPAAAPPTASHHLPSADVSAALCSIAPAVHAEPVAVATAAALAADLEEADQAHLSLNSSIMVDQFVGTWTLSTSENFDDYMKAIGVGFATRQMGNMVKPNLVISVEAGVVSMKSESTFKNTEIKFKLDEEFDETTADGRQTKTTFSFDNGKLVQKQTWDGKTTTLEREIQDGKLAAKCIMEDVVALRTYEKV